MNARGFLYDGVNWTALDMPGASDTMPSGIYGNCIVGSYYYGDYDMPNVSGFIYTIPEPATLFLLALGGLFLKRARR